ncbi:MAG: hypothetical protein Q9227_005531 [Pyrenula ochraceoflavens]
MAPRSSSTSILKLTRCFSQLKTSDPLTQCLASRLKRSLATAVETPSNLSPSNIDLRTTFLAARPPTAQPLVHWPQPPVTTTIYSWPTLEPLSFAQYSPHHLAVPLRRDILHRAVIYEGDKTRQGTASTKWRGEVHGSNRKLHRQKGTGMARARDKKSPIRRGGGVAHGPHPRDFSTGLPRKVYDLAWRTALSYRYRNGELMVIGDKMGIEEEELGPRWLHNVFVGNGWSRGSGRSTLVTAKRRNDDIKGKGALRSLRKVMEEIGKDGLIRDVDEVDVKDLLETRRIVIEKEALDQLLAKHSADLTAAERAWYAKKSRV